MKTGTYVGYSHIADGYKAIETGCGWATINPSGVVIADWNNAVWGRGRAEVEAKRLAEKQNAAMGPADCRDIEPLR